MKQAEEPRPTARRMLPIIWGPDNDSGIWALLGGRVIHLEEAPRGEVLVCGCDF